MPKLVKIKCSVRFEEEAIRIWQLDDVEFYLDDKDENDPNLIIDAELVQMYIYEMLQAAKVNPSDGHIYHEKDGDCGIDEIVSFEVESNLSPKPEPDPNQTDLGIS